MQGNNSIFDASVPVVVSAAYAWALHFDGWDNYQMLWFDLIFQIFESISCFDGWAKMGQTL